MSRISLLIYFVSLRSIYCTCAFSSILPGNGLDSFLFMKEILFLLRASMHGTDQISLLAGSLLSYSPVHRVFISRCLQVADQPESLCATQRRL
jgi:hypothetical protein